MNDPFVMARSSSGPPNQVVQRHSLRSPLILNHICYIVVTVHKQIGTWNLKLSYFNPSFGIILAELPAWQCSQRTPAVKDKWLFCANVAWLFVEDGDAGETVLLHSYNSRSLWKETIEIQDGFSNNLFSHSIPSFLIKTMIPTFSHIFWYKTMLCPQFSMGFYPQNARFRRHG